MLRSYEVEVGWRREGRVEADEVKGWFIWIIFVRLDPEYQLFFIYVGTFDRGEKGDMRT